MSKGLRSKLNRYLCSLVLISGLSFSYGVIQPGFCQDGKSSVNINANMEAIKYRNTINKKLKSNWQKSEHDCRDLTVGFRIAPDGAIKELHIGGDIPNETAEASLKKTFELSSPFDKRPEVLKKYPYAYMYVTWNKLKEYRLIGPFFAEKIEDDIQQTIGMKPKDAYTESMNEKLKAEMTKLKLEKTGKARIFVKLKKNGSVKDASVATNDDALGKKIRKAIKDIPSFGKVPDRFKKEPVFAVILDWTPKRNFATASHCPLMSLMKELKNTPSGKKGKQKTAFKKSPKEIYGSSVRKKIMDKLNRTTTDGVSIHAAFVLNEDGTLKNVFVGAKTAQKDAEAELMQAIKKAAPFPKLPTELNEKRYAWMVVDWEKEDPMWVVNGPFFSNSIMDDVKKIVKMN